MIGNREYMDNALAKPRRMDYHLHTAVTVDGNMNESDACERAVGLGIQEIAFTNHVMLDQPGYDITNASFIAHWENIQICKKRYPQLTIRLGIEMDYYPDRDAEIKAKIESYERLIAHPFDIVLGSIHDIRGGFFSNRMHAVDFFKGKNILSIYHEYFELATLAAQSQLFDIIAHPDLIKKYTYELTPRIPFKSYKSAVESFITALSQYEVGIELNSKGFKRPIKEQYPSMDFIKLYLSMTRSMGTDPIITLGSDAHKVNEIGFGIVEMKESLRLLQVKEIMSFDHRQRSPIVI
jgi:histidinol-phosphatase (PHP family)